MGRTVGFVSLSRALPSLTVLRSFRPISSIDEETEAPAYVPPPVPSQPSGGNEFWESLPF